MFISKIGILNMELDLFFVVSQCIIHYFFTQQVVLNQETIPIKSRYTHMWGAITPRASEKKN